MPKSHVHPFQIETYVEINIQNCGHFIGYGKVRSGFTLSDISLCNDHDEKPVSLRIRLTRPLILLHSLGRFFNVKIT